MVEGAQGRVKELEAQVAGLRAAAAAGGREGGGRRGGGGGRRVGARARAARGAREHAARPEELTRAGVEAERAREELERTVDRLRDNVESLEARLSEERIGKLGGSKGSPGVEGAPAGSTSTMVLRNEFKKMMKDTRAEHQKALKVRRRVVCRIEANWLQSEQEERRRLESMVRTLKREQSARGKPAAKPGT